MDLGIKGRTAIVCASSRGLGRACAMSLAEAGCNLVMNGRDADVLEKTADEIRDTHGVKVIAVACDIGHPDGRKAVLSACPCARHSRQQQRWPTAERLSADFP